MSDIEKHEGFKRTFKNNKLTLGLSVPFDNKQQNNIDFDAHETRSKSGVLGVYKFICER